MKIGIAILCRYNSSRLPGKILKAIHGKPILLHIFERLQLVKDISNIVVATSNQSTDDPIATFCQEQNIQCYRGSLDNVAQRLLEVGQQYDWDYTIRINGDNLFIDIETLAEMLEICKGRDYDFISNVKGRSFPFGMSIEMVRTSFYQKVIEKFREERFFEHVTLYLYEHPECGKQFHFKNEKCSEMKGFKLAIDEQKDFAFALQLMNLLKKENYNYNLSSLYQLIQAIDEK